MKATLRLWWAAALALLAAGTEAPPAAQQAEALWCERVCPPRACEAQDGQCPPQCPPAPPCPSLECPQPICPAPVCPETRCPALTGIPACPPQRPCPTPMCPEPRCPTPVCPEAKCPALPEIPACPAPWCPPCPVPVVKLTCPDDAAPAPTCPSCPEPTQCPPAPPCPTLPSPTVPSPALPPTTLPPTTLPPTTLPPTTLPPPTLQPTTLPPTTLPPTTLPPTTLPPTTPLPTRCAQPEGPPSGYQTYPGVGHYKYHARRASWRAARERCGREGAHLAVPDSPDEVNIFINMMERHGAWNVQIGFLKINGNYETVIGEPLNSFHTSLWQGSYPQPGPSDRGIVLHRDGSLWTYSAHNEDHFICEFSASR